MKHCREHPKNQQTLQPSRTGVRPADTAPPPGLELDTCALSGLYVVKHAAFVKLCHIMS
uniref:Uncharacterized protein n=1 Tax=Anguilla anguilla TaxID=7936 RepID=A0A0E9R8J6_ANGAN